MNHKSQQQIKTKKRINTLKIVSVFLIIGFIFIGLSFAQDSSGKVDNLTQIAHFLISFLSRGRALLAILAGKLMSNDLVYGGFMHLDIFLRKIRNIMKNFANYTLGFLFLYMVIKSIIDKDGAADIIKKKLVGFVLAGILIQASRFLIGALVDISTIAVTAISAIPGQILQSDLGLQKKLNEMNAGGGVSLPATGEIRTGIVMTFDPNVKITEDSQFITTEYKTLDKPITQDNYLDMILPSYNTISGPLIFFGTSIFKFQDFSFSNPNTTTARKRLMEFALNLLIIVIYSLAMLALFVINFFRMFFLRIVIMFSPFIILLGVFDKMGIIKIKGLEKVSISNVLKLIFKPVIFMAYISVMMIFVIGVRAILIPTNGGEVKLNDEITMNSQKAKENSYNSSIKSDGIFNFSVNGAKNSIADLIVFFITLFLLRVLLKAAVSKGSGMEFGKFSLDEKLKGLTDKAQKLAGDIPIVPIAGGIGINQAYKNDDSLLNKTLETGGGMTNVMKKQNLDRLKDSAFGKYYENEGTNYDLEKAAKDSNPDKFWDDAKSYAANQGGISYSGSGEGSKARSDAMKIWFDTYKDKTDKAPDRIRTDGGANITKIDKFIEINYKAIHEKMGGKSDDVPSTADKFKVKEYGKSTT